MLERGPAWMTRPYSEDLRELALARADAGETVRSIAEALQISPSCVTKWKNLRRETRRRFSRQDRRSQEAGSVRHQCRLAAQTHSLRPIHFAEADAGTGCARDQDRRAGSVDVRPCRRAELQKKRSCRPNKIVPISRVNGRAGRPIRAGSTPRAWSLSTRPGSKPTWRRCEAGDRVGNVSRRLRLSAIGRP
ncbi:hypothetical protein ACVWY2_008011 [Bradyrhizobium sp. JR6.1]